MPWRRHKQLNFSFLADSDYIVGSQMSSQQVNWQSTEKLKTVNSWLCSLFKCCYETVFCKKNLWIIIIFHCNCIIIHFHIISYQISHVLFIVSYICKYSTSIAKCPTVCANDSHQTHGTLSVSSITGKKCHNNYYARTMWTVKITQTAYTAQVTIARIWSFVFVLILLCAVICANNTANQHNVFQSYFYTMIV